MPLPLPCPSHAESGAAQENHSHEQSTRCELCTLPAVIYMRIVDGETRGRESGLPGAMQAR
jgi:hypothetical protein